MDPSHAVAHSAASHRGTHVPLLSEPIDPQTFVRATLLSRLLDGVPQKYRHPDLWPGQLDDVVSPVASPAPFQAFENWNQVAGAVELIAAGSSVPPVPLLPQPAPIDYRNPCCATGLGTASPSSLTHGSRTMPACSHACTCSGTYSIVEFKQSCSVCHSIYYHSFSRAAERQTKQERRGDVLRSRQVTTELTNSTRYYKGAASTSMLFKCTSNTFYQNAFMHQVSLEQEAGHMPFFAKSEAMQQAMVGHSSRPFTDRSVFVTHWLIWTAIRWLSEYGLPMHAQFGFKHKRKYAEIDAELLRIYDLVYPRFVSKWTQDSISITCDGHFKTWRRVCANKFKSFYEVVPGEWIPVHCELTNKRGSRYCPDCMPALEDVPEGELLQPAPRIYNLRNKEVGEYVVDYVADYNEKKKEYLVHWDGYDTDGETWEPEGHLPENVRLSYKRSFLEPTREERKEPENSCAGADKEATSGKRRKTTACAGANKEASTKQTEAAQTSVGVVCAIWSNQITAGVCEIFGSESKSQMCKFLLKLLQQLPEEKWPKFLAYDDACHLYKYLKKRESECPQFKRLLEKITLCCDRLHFRNHVDPWCKQHMDPNSHPELDGINTMVCEQKFKWLAQFKHIVRPMNQAHFKFYILRMLELNNQRQTRNLERKRRSAGE